MNENNKIPKREMLAVVIGEAVVAAIVCLIFLVIGKFDYTVALGAALGGGVIIFNFAFLCISVNKALDDVLVGFDPSKIETTTAQAGDGEDGDGERSSDGESELDENDAAAKFASENQAKLQNAIKTSYLIRTFSMVAALVVAFLTGIFNVVATAIPMLFLRTILNVSEMIKRKKEDGK